MNEATTADCYPVTVMPGQSRLFLDFCAGALRAVLPLDEISGERPALPAHWPELVRLLAAQNSSGSAAAALAALEQGAGTILTGQQVGLFGGPLYTPFKAATAIARARKSSAAGHPHVAIFWLASEDHDFAEINQVTFPAGRELATLAYASAPEAALPAGRIVLDESITALTERAAEIFSPSEATDALIAVYQPGRTFAEAFAAFYARVFAPQGLLIVDAAGREFHRLGAPVLRAAIERADEFHAALVERSQALEAAGYHSQVLVAPHSSLLFLMDETSGARLALKRIAPTAEEPNGLWHAANEAGNQRYSTADLVGILDAEPERISPAALLRPVFQDFLFGTTAQVGGPAEIAYLAQSTVLFERILGRQTPPIARFSATLIEPHVAELLRKHELTLEAIFGEENAAALALRLAARSMPTETKKKLAAAGNAMDAELDLLVGWMQSQDKGLGQSGETGAGKIRYQMNRLRTLAANFQLQKEATLTRHANSIFNALYPGSVLQERVHGAAYYFARHGLDLAETLCERAGCCSGHTALWL
ncbi:MAG: bacillithiol biosynthesis cysteine-adding enzyme BshC [Terracidiphilus sp.]|nr:bacillithiol biosynthesis cysteine-adding enzyme BshC [Terracidiphilus sp.]MDR3796821.1 bacillithiol biosynthesis cysteine-adding enzyme BshC [Terracidiphilus sp.]